MTDMSQFSTVELLADLNDTHEDIVACETALKCGVTEYSGGSVQHRLDTNIKILDKIKVELKHRNQATVVVMQPCGHPLSAIEGDGMTHWCGMCGEEAQ